MIDGDTADGWLKRVSAAHIQMCHVIAIRYTNTV